MIKVAMQFLGTAALAIAFVVPKACAQEDDGRISAFEALEHVGEEATVCDSVASTRYASSSRGQPTFLNLGRAYPNQPFTIVIWGSNRSNFPEAPERAYAHTRVCVTGGISEFGGVPQIVVEEPRAIEIEVISDKQE